MPNALDVLSNAPFLIAGLLGLFCLAVRPRAALSRTERCAFLVLFLGLCGTGLGSAWYHLAPDNDRLFWDRLPLALVLMPFFALVLGDRLGPRMGALCLLAGLFLGPLSVLHWRQTEAAGAGDLRAYALVQFFPLAALPVLLLFHRARRLPSTPLLVILGLYALAKGFELLDRPIFARTGCVSGHTLKHLAAGVAACWMLRLIPRTP